MKVLKEAAAWKKEIECGDYYGCGAVMEIDENDILVKERFDVYECDYEDYFEIKCPCCNREIELSNRDIPARIRVRLLAEKKANIFSRSMERRKFYEE